MADATPRISLRNIRKNFGSLQALRGVDLDIHPGECLGLVGDNAAGKSTLTKIISGVYIPDDGTISVDGVPVRFSGPAEARSRNIEMVFQDLSLCDHIDVVGNLFLGRERTSGPLPRHQDHAGRGAQDAGRARDPHPAADQQGCDAVGRAAPGDRDRARRLVQSARC